MMMRYKCLSTVYIQVKKTRKNFERNMKNMAFPPVLLKIKLATNFQKESKGANQLLPAKFNIFKVDFTSNEL